MCQHCHPRGGCAGVVVVGEKQYKKQVELTADIRRRDEEIAKYTKMIGEQMDTYVMSTCVHMVGPPVCFKSCCRSCVQHGHLDRDRTSTGG